MIQRISTVLTCVVVVIAVGLIYRLVKSQITADVYRERLVQLSQNYEQLRQTYNQAIRKTAVTELLVADRKLCVVIRTAEGTLETIQTNLDPNKEIYVDFVILEGRLWIRRVFDEDTPPGKGVVVDPKLAEVDWNRDLDGDGHGKATYRRLTDGRWAVTVSGNGALTLAKVDSRTALDLVRPPALGRFEPVNPGLMAIPDNIGPTDVVRQLVSP